MRLTNVMLTNTTLMHINRNARNLDRVIGQISTGRRIQRPSDDPIIASRALMFRTSLHENGQFRRNVDQGFAWMNVSESTFNNINQQLIFEMRNLLVQGATGTNYLDDKKAIIGQMRSLFDQMGHEVNQTFGGNYLFSGFRTDEPPVFNADNDRSFIITQHFGAVDISRESSFQRLVMPGQLGIEVPVTRNINVLKLAYTRLDADPVIPGFEVRNISINDHDAYLPPEVNDDGVPVIHFIPETGELVMHSETAANFPREGVSVTFQKTGFRQGELNPMVYFTGREILTNDTLHIPAGTQLIYNITQYFSRAAGTPVAGDMIEFNLAFPPYNPAAGVPTDLMASLPRGSTIDLAAGTVQIPNHVFNTSTNVSVTYAIELNDPIVAAGGEFVHIMAYTGVQGVQLARAIGVDGIAIPLDQMELNRSFDMRNQNIQYEFSTRTLITVNSLAKNVLTDKMFADFTRFFAFADSLHITEESVLRQYFTDLGHTEDEVTTHVAAQLAREGREAVDALQRQFDNLLFRIDRHAENSTREQTDLGARMVRLELVQNRLEEDEVTYTLLTSDNEDTDLIRATIQRFSLEAIFMASLRANAGVLQMSLANFLR